MIHGKKKWNGLGGKLEPGETMVEAAVREFHEEADCTTHPSQWRRLGELYFPNFMAEKNEDWWVTVFVTDLSDEQISQIPLEDSLRPEGSLHFVPLSRVDCLDLWEGDRLFLPYVFERKPFQGTLFYLNGRCVRHELSAII
jgi:8-oxo-dGTP diphosphatase